MRRFLSCSAMSIVLLSGGLVTPVSAQAADPQDKPQDEEPATSSAPAADEVSDDLHDRRLDFQGNIIVSGTGLKQLDVLAGTSVIEGAALQRNLSGQIGEVLAKLPGVTATGFSPAVSRPVLRGFSGERVRVLIDGIGTIDASNTSDDHAVAIDPISAERIEVLRGPAVLLYGSQAIGGAVNVIDKRIPRRIPDEPVHVDGLAAFDSVSDQYQFGASADAPLGGGFVVHADGSSRDSGDLEVAGLIASESLRADLLAEAAVLDANGQDGQAAQLRDFAAQRGVLRNTAAQSWSANAGFAFFAGDSNLGASVGWYNTDYGVPERPGVSEAGADPGAGDGVSIGLEQFRADLRGELDLGDGFLDRMVTRVGYTDYKHTEFEGDEIGTVFNIDGIEARAELVQSDEGALRGSFGAQYFFRDFEAIGEEAFVAPNRTTQIGLFALQEYGTGPVEIEAAGRFEQTSVNSSPLGIERDFDSFSGALGLSYETEAGLRFGVNGTRVVRAPSGEELFANGPHIATQAFEVGDTGLAQEKAWGIEGSVRGNLGPAQVSFAVYRNWFDAYIFLTATGEEEGGLPVFAYRQDDARYFGLEGEVSLPFYRSGGLTLLADLSGDYIRANLADGTPLPRIPPLSLLGAIEAQSEALDGRIELQWFDGQDRTAPFETATGGFALVNTSVSWKPFRGRKNVTFLVQVDNAFNAAGRRHVSFTKDFVPLAGRNVKASARFSF